MKNYCSKCEKYTNTEIHGIHLLYEGCGVCGLDIKQSVMSGAKFIFESHLMSINWVLRPIYRFKLRKLAYIALIVLLPSCSKYIYNYNARVIDYQTDFFNTNMVIQDLKTGKKYNVPVDFSMISFYKRNLSGDTINFPYIEKKLLKGNK